MDTNTSNPNGNPGAGTGPQPFIDPNPTRYIPPQDIYAPTGTGSMPNTPLAPGAQGATATAGAPPQPQAQQPGGYAQAGYTPPAYTPPANGSAVPGNGNAPAYRPTPMLNGTPAAPWRRDRDRTVLALILIGGGVLFLLDQLRLFWNMGSFVPLLIGAIFMYAYFSTRPGYRIGFLIPGAILMGIGVGEVIKSLTFWNLWAGGDITAVTLGLGFCMIWFFERKHWWALIPGGILVLSGLSSIAMIGSLWPLALIALGAYLLYDQSRRRPR